MEVQCTRVHLVPHGHSHPTPDPPAYGRRGGLLCRTTLTFGGLLAVHDVKLVQVRDGRLLASFPNHTTRRACPTCARGCREHHAFCPFCGRRLSPPPQVLTYHDDVHPVTAEYRAVCLGVVLDAFRAAGGIVPEPFTVEPPPPRPTRGPEEGVEERHP